MGEEAKLVSPDGRQLHVHRLLWKSHHHPDIDLILNLF
jgi:hypothetical protein